MSRVTRRFLLGGLILAGGLIVAEESAIQRDIGRNDGFTQAAEEAAVVEADPTLVMERFEQQGIGLFYEEFVLDQTVEHELGVTLPSDGTNELSTVMGAVASDQADMLPAGLLDKIRTGWSEEPDREKRNLNARQVGFKKITGLELITDATGVDNVDYYTILGSLANYSQTYPCAAEGVDRYVEVISTGGWFVPGAGGGIEITSFLVSPELAYISLLHEGMHAYEYDPFRPEIRAIMRMEDATSYRFVKKNETYRTLRDYFDSDWTEAKHFKAGSYIINDDVIRTTITPYLTLEQRAVVRQQPKLLDSIGLETMDQIAQELGVNLNDAPLDPGEQATLHSNYNRLSYLVGKKRLSLASKLGNTTLADDERRFMNDPRARTARQLAADDINHYYVGPIQTLQHTLPRNIGEMDSPETRLGQGNYVVQSARLRYLSTIPYPTFENLRGSLGLGPN